MPHNINFGTSVLKRESRGIDGVESKLLGDGWEKTGTIAGGRVRYYEKSGINITAMSGLMGTVIFPSGPLRGSIFGDEAVVFNKTSSIGEGQPADKENKVRADRRSGEMT